MAHNARMSALGLTGYPARIFFEMTNYGRGTQTHIEKMVILQKWYSHLRAHLPVLYEKKPDEYNNDIAPIMTDASTELDKLEELYDPLFEDVANCNPEEKLFLQTMRNVFERLDEITARSKVIDGVSYEGMVEVG